MSKNKMSESITETRSVTLDAAKRELRVAMKRQRPVFLWGPPGIGKSELRVGISSFAGDSGTSDQGVIGSENQRHRVEQVQFFLHDIKVKQLKEKAT